MVVLKWRSMKFSTTGISKVLCTCTHKSLLWHTHTHMCTLEEALHGQLTLHVKLSGHAGFSVTALCNCPDSLNYRRADATNLACVTFSCQLPRSDQIFHILSDSAREDVKLVIQNKKYKTRANCFLTSTFKVISILNCNTTLWYKVV